MSDDHFGRLLGPRPLQHEPQLEAALDRAGIGYREFIDWRIERTCVPWGLARQLMYVAIFAAERDAAHSMAQTHIEKIRRA